MCMIVRNLGVRDDDDGDNDDNDNTMYTYHPSGAYDLGWLGYVIGKNKYLTEFDLYKEDDEAVNNNLSRQYMISLSRGFNQNESIKHLDLTCYHLADGECFQLLGSFFKNNPSLVDIIILGCTLRRECAHQLALVLGSFPNSLGYFGLNGCEEIDEESFAENFRALAIHPQLESLDLQSNVVNRMMLIELAMLMRGSFLELKNLYLCGNTIDDAGIDVSMMTLTLTESALKNLSLVSTVLSHTEGSGLSQFCLKAQTTG